MSPPARPRVLFLTPRFPFPIDRGDRLHAYHLLRVFSERNDVTLVTFDERTGNREGGEERFRSWGVRTIAVPLPLSGRLWRLAMAMGSGEPLQVAYYAEPGMREALRALERTDPPFDALVCHLIRTARFASAVRAPTKVISLADSLALSLGRRLRRAPWPERPSIWFERMRVEAFEKRVLGAFDEGWVVSPVDLDAFPGGPEKLRVLPAGVDQELLRVPISQRTDPVIGFLGHLSVPHNVDAVATLIRDVLPRVRARLPEARVRLIGGSPAPLVLRLARQPDVELTGFVPDLGRAMASLRVLCAPISFSAGVQSKLIDAIVCGVPVITTPQAAAPLGPLRSWIDVASSAEEFAAAVERRWNRTREDCERLERARHAAAATFSWSGYADRLAELLDARRQPNLAESGLATSARSRPG